MVFTYLSIADLIEMAGKEEIKDIHSLAAVLSLRFSKIYEYRVILNYLLDADDERSRRIKNSLFNHILNILQLDPHDVSDKCIEQPIII